MAKSMTPKQKTARIKELEEELKDALVISRGVIAETNEQVAKYKASMYEAEMRAARLENTLREIIEVRTSEIERSDRVFYLARCALMGQEPMDQDEEDLND
jgi:predicted nucleic acid-binding protein